MQLLREVVLDADLVDRLELRLQPVDVLLLVHEDVARAARGCRVVLVDGERDAAVEPLERRDLDREVAANCSGTDSPTRNGPSRCRLGTPSR